MHRKWLQISFYISLFAIVAALVFLVYLKFVLPDVGEAPDLKIAPSPVRLARGRYLVWHVARCMDCHSDRNLHLEAGPVVRGTQGEGGEIFDETKGLPGRFVAKNITPYHLGHWTDGEIFRAITCGVRRDGKALYPAMPYLNYGQLDTGDIYDIIAYIRTLPGIPKKIAPSRADFPMNWEINTLPRKPDFHPRPSRKDQVKYGRYLVLMANCAGCHNEDFSGGDKFPLATGGIVSAANITPDLATGIGAWTRMDFIHRFKSFADSCFKPRIISPDTYNTVMPWTFFAGMKSGDIAAIYAYLHTVKPVDHAVTRFIP
ncbi:MAG TPA: c-type cytochrome [Chitinophagaceae bacterium]|nr:c-type cytochrome [Chitinophagaceae bacterium]